MTNHTQANNGVAYGVEVFQPADAEALRVNADLAWRNIALTLGRSDIDLTDLDTAATFKQGAFTWNSALGCYVSVSSKVGSPDSHIIIAAGAGGRPVASLKSTALPDMGTGSAGSHVPSMAGKHYAIYNSAGTPADICVSSSDDFSTWTQQVFVADALDFTPAPGVPGCYSSDTRYFVPGHTSTSTPAILAIYGNGSGTVSKKVVGSTADTTSGDVMSVAANSTNVVGVTASATTGVRFGNLTAGPTAVSVSIPIFSDAEQTGQKRIAYDPRIGKFVLMVAGLPAGPNPSNLYWVTSTDGATWSGTVGWKRMAPSWLDATILEGFTVTPDGIWIVTCRTATVGGFVVDRLLASIDAGANWQELSLGITNYLGGVATNPWRFGSPGPGLVAMKQTGTTMASIITGGIRSTGTEIASVDA